MHKVEHSGEPNYHNLFWGNFIYLFILLLYKILMRSSLYTWCLKISKI